MTLVLNRIETERVDPDDEKNIRVLADDIDHIVGPEFLENIRLEYKAYGKMLGVGEVESDVNLLDELRNLSAAIVAYGVQVSAIVDEEDVATLRMAERLVAAIDLHRAKTAREGTSSAEPEVPAPVSGEPVLPVKLPDLASD